MRGQAAPTSIPHELEALPPQSAAPFHLCMRCPAFLHRPWLYTISRTAVSSQFAAGCTSSTHHVTYSFQFTVCRCLQAPPRQTAPLCPSSSFLPRSASHLSSSRCAQLHRVCVVHVCSCAQPHTCVRCASVYCVCVGGGAHTSRAPLKLVSPRSATRLSSWGCGLWVCARLHVCVLGRTIAHGCY